MKDELKDRILFVYSVDTNWERYSHQLVTLGYDVELYESKNLSLVPKHTFDLVIICLDDIGGPKELLSELKKQFIAPSTPCILLSNNNTHIENLDFPSVYLLSYADDLSKFLVQVRIQLRLRKVRSEHVMSQVEVVSENATLRDLNNRFQRDLIEAREIHEKILPHEIPECKNIQCASAYLPLELVGGDLFDIWKIDEDSIGVFLGDITGHGLPAAFIASMTKMCLALSPSIKPSETLSFMNQKLYKYLPDGRFITALYCIINQKEQTLTYANAGHPPLLLFKKISSEVITLSQKGMPLNVDQEYIFEEYVLPIEKNDMILLYTDGLYETVNMENKILGIKGLSDEYKKLAMCNEIDGVISGLIEFLNSFAEGRMYRDDITAIGIELL